MFPTYHYFQFPDNPTKPLGWGAIFWGFFGILLAIALSIAVLGAVHPMPDREQPQTVITTEVYTHYTIEYYNGAVDYVHVDDSYTFSCDGGTSDDNGQTCVLSHDNSLLFLNAVWNGENPNLVVYK